jgi:hypothetical protein
MKGIGQVIEVCVLKTRIVWIKTMYTVELLQLKFLLLISYRQYGSSCTNETFTRRSTLRLFHVHF